MLKNIYTHFMHDSLYRNSIYLMMSTAVMAVLGFFFWIINARIFSSNQIGLATTMISIATLISSFSLLGLNVGLVHYLPTSEQKSNKINTSFTLVFLTASLLTIGYIASIHYFSPKLSFLQENLFSTLLFILLVASISLSSLIDTVFTAYRSTQYVLLKNTSLSIAKVSLPLLFISFGAFGIFMAFGFSSLIAFLLGILFLIMKFHFKISPSVHMEVVEKMIKFSFVNYLAGFIGLLPFNMLPILITNKLGASPSAYFYICMMIANILYIIPTATSQSLFAEGSYSEEEIRNHLKKAIQIILLLMFPAIVMVFFFGNLILGVFGEQYVSEGFTFLRIIALGSLCLGISQIGYVLANIEKKASYNIYLNSLNTIVVLGLSYILLPYHLFGVGIAWISGQVITAVLYVILLRKFFL